MKNILFSFILLLIFSSSFAQTHQLGIKITPAFHHQITALEVSDFGSISFGTGLEYVYFSTNGKHGFSTGLEFQMLQSRNATFNNRITEHFVNIPIHYIRNFKYFYAELGLENFMPVGLLAVNNGARSYINYEGPQLQTDLYFGLGKEFSFSDKIKFKTSVFSRKALIGVYTPLPRSIVGQASFYNYLEIGLNTGLYVNL